MTEKQKILVIDDDKITQIVMKNSLKENFDVLTVSSLKDAQGQLSQGFIPDLILLDVVMPEADGFTVIAEFKKNPALAQIPVIFLTSTLDDRTELRGFEAGAVDFIRKPLVKEILYHRIAVAMELSMLRRKLNEKKVE